MVDGETKTTRTLGAWVRLITAAATAAATVAATGAALYAALDGVQKSREAGQKAEAADNKADGAYAALASKIDALSIEVAYLKGKIDGQAVAVRRTPERAPARPPLEPELIPKVKKPSAFKKGARFKVKPFQDLPDRLDDLVQRQEEYQDQ